MRSTGTSTLLSIAAIAVYISFLSSAAAQYPPSADDGSASVPSDLASMLESQPAGNKELLAHALRIIRPLESSPTCNRLATLTLINSCKSLEASQHESKKRRDPEETLDLVKSEYAARLAACEFMPATITPPKECAMLVASSDACVKPRFRALFHWSDNKSVNSNELCYPEATRDQFNRCLKTLDSRPQWWTSYSNARQNAVVMCQASRVAVDREEKIAVFNSLTEAAASITSALLKSLDEAQARLEEQKAFLESLRASQVKASKDLESSRKETTFTLTQMASEVNQIFQSFMEVMTSGRKTAHSQANDLNEALEKSKNSVSQTREQLQTLSKEMELVNSQYSSLTELQAQQLYANRDTALAVQHSLDSVRTDQLNALSQSITGLRDELVLSSVLMEEMHYRQTTLDDRMDKLGSSFDSLENTADNLRSTIDETTGSLKLVASLVNARPGPISAALILSLGLWFVNKKASGVFMILAGSAYLITTLFSALDSERVPPMLFHPFSIAAWLAACVIACVFTYRRWARRDCICYRVGGKEMILASIEEPC